MKRVYFKAKVKDIPYNLTPEGYFILKLTQHNIHKWPGLIQKCIDKFNSEVEWDEMWNELDSEGRFELGNVLFVYLKIGNYDDPIGYTWFDGDWLYNTFIHSTRPKGHSSLFIQECCHSLDSSISEIELFCDDWNLKAQKLFEKVGFNKV